MDAPAKDRGYSRRVMRAVALAASASLVFAACAVYASSQGSTTAISDVILPMGDMPPAAGVSKATRQLIDEAVNGEPMAKSISTKLTQIAEDAASQKVMDGSDVRLINQAVQEAVKSAEGAVKKDVQTEVKAAVKDAIRTVLAAATENGAQGRGSEGKVAARGEERKEYTKELNHITGELTNQLGGLARTNLKIDLSRHVSARAAHAAHKTSPSDQQVATLVQAASADTTKPVGQEGMEGIEDHQSSGRGGAVVKGSVSQDKADGRSQGSSSETLSEIETDKAAEVMKMQEKRAARKRNKEITASIDAATALRNMAKKVSSGKTPAKKVKAVSKSVEKAETLVQADGTKVPISSRHDPTYVHSEESRDQQAADMLKKLQVLKRAKLAKTLAVHPTLVAQPHADRNAIAAKYLRVMEKEALKKHVSLAKAQDRSVLAQKYLQQLKKISGTAHKNAPKGSRHNAKYVNAEHSRDTQAAQDMALLKKDQAIVKTGNKVEKVKLSKTVVSGPDTLDKERAALTRPKTDRTLIANQDLKKIRPLMHKFRNAHVGKYLHATSGPANAKKLHLTTKAQADLAQLQHLEKHPTRHTAGTDRNVVALVDLKKLEAHSGTTSLPQLRPVKPESADALAAKDLKTLAPSAVTAAAPRGNDASALSMISQDLKGKTLSSAAAHSTPLTK